MTPRENNQNQEFNGVGLYEAGIKHVVVNSLEAKVSNDGRGTVVKLNCSIPNTKVEFKNLLFSWVDFSEGAKQSASPNAFDKKISKFCEKLGITNAEYIQLVQGLASNNDEVIEIVNIINSKIIGKECWIKLVGSEEEYDKKDGSGKGTAWKLNVAMFEFCASLTEGKEHLKFDKTNEKEYKPLKNKPAKKDIPADESDDLPWEKECKPEESPF